MIYLKLGDSKTFDLTLFTSSLNILTKVVNSQFGKDCSFPPVLTDFNKTKQNERKYPFYNRRFVHRLQIYNLVFEVTRQFSQIVLGLSKQILYNCRLSVPFLYPFFFHQLVFT